MSRLLYGLRTVRGTRRFWRFGETSLSSVRQRWLSKSTEEAVNNILFNPQAAEKYESYGATLFFTLYADAGTHLQIAASPYLHWL